MNTSMFVCALFYTKKNTLYKLLLFHISHIPFAIKHYIILILLGTIRFITACYFTYFKWVNVFIFYLIFIFLCASKWVSHKTTHKAMKKWSFLYHLFINKNSCVIFELTKWLPIAFQCYCQIRSVKNCWDGLNTIFYRMPMGGSFQAPASDTYDAIA